jgi:hypothetical protein
MKLLGIHGVGSCKSVMRSDMPCHCMASERAVRAADDFVGFQEQARPDRVGKRRHERRTAAEASLEPACKF